MERQFASRGVTAWRHLARSISLAALTAAAKAKQLTLASSGNGTVGHLVGETWKRAAGVDPQPGTAAEFGAYLDAERQKWARAVKASGATVD